MSFKRGLDAKLYYCAAGIGGSPSWLELTNVKNVTLTMTSDEADATTRNNNGFKASVATLKDASIEFDMVWDTDDPGFTALKDAWFNNDVIGLAVMDGAVDDPDSQGLVADCMITEFSRDEQLTDVLSTKVTAKPTYSDNPPEWKESIGGSGST